MPSLAEAMKPLLAPTGAAVAANAFRGLVPVPSLAETKKPLMAPMMATAAANAFARLEAIERAEVTESNPILSHEQKRRLFAVYVYVLAQVL